MTAPTRTFPAYIEHAGLEIEVPGFPADFGPRVRHVRLGSLIALQKWTRERWPDFYHQHAGGHGPTGQLAVRRLWAAYLAWAER